MAVLKIKPKKIVDFFLPLVERELVLGQIATKVSGDMFKGTLGDTITLRIPGLKATARDYEWRTRTAPIVLDDIGGGAAMAFNLNTHIYSATGLTDEHMTMDDIDFVTEVVNPQAAAVAERIESKVLTAFRAVVPKFTVAFQAGDDPFLAALEARRLMNSSKVAPAAGRVHLVGSDVAAAWVASDRLSRYDSIGQEGTPAVRDATVGRLAGDPVVEVPWFNPNEAYYMHKSALLFATIAPVQPQGASASAAVTSRGLGFRWLQDYDPNYLRDRSIVSAFFGAVSVRDERNADGSWMFETGDLSADELAATGQSAAVQNVVGTRKNVRVVKYDVTGTGSVLPPTVP